MEISLGEEETARLYDAAMKGCTATLDSLIQKDKLILNKASLSSFAETPLHISSLLGHLDFTTAILAQNPRMASRFDSLKRSPLHLASAEGHTDIIKALLAVNSDVCLIRDEDGRIPLHLAAMRGNVESIRELVRARPESISERLEGDTVLHLCVKYNHLEALKLLVEIANGDALVSGGNQDGNTILHLAVMLKQLEAISYILSMPEAIAEITTMNIFGFTALDILDHSPRDFKSPEIRDMLIEAGATRVTKPVRNLPPTQPSADANTFARKASRGNSWLNRCARYVELHGDWIEESQGTLMTVATLIATMTFETAISPPGGVWQEDVSDSSKHSNCSENNVCLAGTAVFAYSLPKSHKLFMSYNSISFVASLIVIFLIISGFPLRNKICTWILTMAMSTTLVFMALTYLVSLDMVTPDDILSQLSWIKKVSLFVWLGTVAMVSLIHIYRVLYWTSKSSRRCRRRQKRRIKNLLNKFQGQGQQNLLTRV